MSEIMEQLWREDPDLFDSPSVRKMRRARIDRELALSDAAVEAMHFNLLAPFVTEGPRGAPDLRNVHERTAKHTHHAPLSAVSGRQWKRLGVVFMAGGAALLMSGLLRLVIR